LPGIAGRLSDPTRSPVRRVSPVDTGHDTALEVSQKGRYAKDRSPLSPPPVAPTAADSKSRESALDLPLVLDCTRAENHVLLKVAVEFRVQRLLHVDGREHPEAWAFKASAVRVTAASYGRFTVAFNP
jgi:hypothetical protein